MSVMTARRSLTAVAIAAFLVSGCGSGGSPAAPASSSAPTTTVDFAPPTSAPSASATPTAPAPSTSPRPPNTPAPAPAPKPCGGTATWGTGPKTADGSSRDALYLVRAGRHNCYDRVVFDINGPAAAGFSVRYVPVVTSDPKGDPLPVAGSAVLQVVVRAPEQGADDSGHQPGRMLAQVGDYFYTAAQLATWPSLRAVRFAGFFEGQCTFAVGVRAQLPFRVFTLLGPADQVRRVVVDIAH